MIPTGLFTHERRVGPVEDLGREVTMMHSNCRRTLLIASALIVSHVGSAAAQNLPNTINRLANELWAACAASKGEATPDNSGPSNSLVRMVATLRSGTLYVVDYTQTPCEDSGTVCGTGGCPLGVFRVKGDVVETLFDRNAFSWELTRDKRRIGIGVHGSYCRDGSGPVACVLEINLETGARRYGKGA